MLNHYFFTVCVVLRTPYKEVGEDGRETPIPGFFTNFGVTALDEWAARSLVESVVEDGEIDWKESSFKEIDLQNFKADIVKHCKDPSKAGVWFKGSKFLFPADDEGKGPLDYRKQP